MQLILGVGKASLCASPPRGYSLRWITIIDNVSEALGGSTFRTAKKFSGAGAQEGTNGKGKTKRREKSFARASYVAGLS
jgi:hypothetical protein